MANKYQHSSLGDLLLVFRRKILESIRKEGFKHDLTFSQAEVLYFIGPYGKTTMKNIADYLKITPPSVTEIITEMEKRGFVKRQRDNNDRRVVFIVFSAMARKLFVSLSRRRNLVLNNMITKLPKKDRKSLERIIKILVTL